MKILYNEHEIIKSVIGYRNKISALAKSNPELYKQIMTLLIGFFRNYADKFHHQKEERLLFPLMCERNEILKDNIIEEMLENHNDFRNLITRIESSVESGYFEASNELFLKYSEMLLNHIAVEDEELFQMALSLFEDIELEKMYYDFEDIDNSEGIDIKNDFEKLIEKLERELTAK